MRLPAGISARYAREGEAGVRLRELLGLTERTAGRPPAERVQREAMLGPLREAHMATEASFDDWWPDGAGPLYARRVSHCASVAATTPTTPPGLTVFKRAYKNVFLLRLV